jgi:hypothetical protein
VDKEFMADSEQGSATQTTRRLVLQRKDGITATIFCIRRDGNRFIWTVRGSQPGDGYKIEMGTGGRILKMYGITFDFA